MATGSADRPAWKKAIAWTAEEMKAAGLSNVRSIPTKVPQWVRGAESARIVAPFDRPPHMLGLGSSIATPPAGITAEVFAVTTFDEFANLGREKIHGKIVVKNEPFNGYCATRVYPCWNGFHRAKVGPISSRRGPSTPCEPREVSYLALVPGPTAARGAGLQKCYVDSRPNQ